MLLDDLPTLTDEQLDKTASLMGNWLTISRRLREAKLPEVAIMLRTEIDRKRRLDVVHRIHARYTALRKDKEQMEILRYLAHVQG